MNWLGRPESESWLGRSESESWLEILGSWGIDKSDLA